MADTWQIFLSVLGVFLVMGLGAGCRYRGWLTRDADRSLANLTAKVFLPALFVDRILSGELPGSLLETWIPPVVGFGVTMAGLVMGLGVAKVMGPLLGLHDSSQQRSFALGVGICNYGFIPLPLAERFYPDAFVDLILHNVGVDLALWSVGVAIIRGRSVAGGLRWQSLISPPLVAVVVAVMLRRTGADVWIPDPVLQATEKLGSCAVPLGLLLTGALIIDFLRAADWKGSTRTIIAAILFRQAWMPIAMLAFATFFAFSLSMRQVLMLQAAMPAAVFPIVLARLYDRDTVTALRVVLSTSLAGIVLVPVWLAIGKWWLGI